MTPEVRAVLEARSVRDKIAVAIDCDVAPVGQLNIVAALVRDGVLVWIDRTTLPHVGIQTPDGRVRLANVDVYQLTSKGIALCNANGIKQR